MPRITAVPFRGDLQDALWDLSGWSGSKAASESFAAPWVFQVVQDHRLGAATGYSPFDAATIATMPTFTAGGRRSQAATTWARSSGMNVALSGRLELPEECAGSAGVCSETGEGGAGNALACLEFASFCSDCVVFEGLVGLGSNPAPPTIHT